MWRQGDILIAAIEAVPANVVRLKRPVLAAGDSSGHRHEIADRGTARLFAAEPQFASDLYLEVTADEARLVHPEHQAIVLPRGAYRVWRQREFDEYLGARFVAD
jgi:hypothetical protein